MPSLFQQFQQIILPILPEAVVIIVALLVLILDFFVEKERKAILGWFSLAGIIIAAASAPG
jgi:NADH:ubiquinone oxidoreductase subunit 2 (subunit N)